MMKKNYAIIFVAICMVLCLIPSLGMLFFPTTRTTENRAMAAAPKLLTEEGSLNKSFIQDFESYFTEHIALRNPMIYMDAQIQAGIFGESNVSGVISGTDGWLYYASTLNDYQGQDVMTERSLFNLAHNISIVQTYLESKNIDFVFTIAPNKNTLYGENMPYYKSQVVNADHSAKLLQPYLEQQGVQYLDLFRLFEEQEEILYMKTDSHWNMKGACLAYNGILDSLAIPHEDYSGQTPTQVETKEGDLNKMLYSFYGKAETDYAYDLAGDYTYTTGTNVEDGWIVTENTSGTGSILMFRDSFGNTLIPFFSSQFRNAYYSKGEPNAVERYVEANQVDCVVIEKVERNIVNYLNNPPILTAPAVELPSVLTIADTQTSIEVEESMNDINYYKFTGTADAFKMKVNSQILVRINGVAYQAYQTGSGNDFCLYLKKDAFTEKSVEAEVYILNGVRCLQALSTTIELP